MAYLTWEDTVSDGAQLTYGIVPPYLSQDHINVYFNGVAQPTSSFTFPDANNIKLVSPAAKGVTVRVARDTPKTLLTDFQTMVTEGDLDGAYLHALYRTQELQDKWDEAVAGAVAAQPAIKNNLTAIVSPTVGDDSDDGYAVGSFWFDTVLKLLYQASDVTVGAAVWNVIGRNANVAAVPPGVSDDSSKGYVVGDNWWDTASGTIYTCTNNSVGAATWGSLSPSSISYPLTHTGLVYRKKGADTATASVIDLSTVGGNYIKLTGTTTVTQFTNVPAGANFTFEIVDGCTFQYNDPKIRTPNNVDSPFLAGDIVEIHCDGSDNVTVTNHYPHDNRAPISDDWIFLESAASGSTTALDFTGLITKYAGVKHFKVELLNISVDTADTEILGTIDYGSGFLSSGFAGLLRPFYETGVASGVVWPTSEFRIAGSTTAGWGLGTAANEGLHHANVYFWHVDDNTRWTPITGDAIWNNVQWMKTTANFGAQETAGKVDGIRIKPAAGNMSITARLYGMI